MFFMFQNSLLSPNMMCAWACLVFVLFAGGLPQEWAVVQAQSSRPGNTAYLAYLKNLQAGNRTVGPAGLGGRQYPPFANAQGQEFDKQLRECKFLSCFEYHSSRAHTLVMSWIILVKAKCHSKYNQY